MPSRPLPCPRKPTGSGRTLKRSLVALNWRGPGPCNRRRGTGSWPAGWSSGCSWPASSRCAPNAWPPVTAAQACGSGPAVNHGRPGYLLDGVPAPVAFSASRAAGWTVLAAMVETVPGFRVGVDIEDPERTGFAGFTALALTPAEQRTVRHLSGSALLAERARLWARKEAWLKMTGEGLRTAPSAVDVLERAGVQDLPPAETGLPPGLAAAVAMSGEGTQRPGSGGSDSS